jgi:hypothetical protein
MQSVHAMSETLEFYRRLLEVECAKLALLEDEESRLGEDRQVNVAVVRQRRVVAGIKREIETLEDVLAVRTA